MGGLLFNVVGSGDSDKGRSGAVSGKEKFRQLALLMFFISRPDARPTAARVRSELG